MKNLKRILSLALASTMLIGMMVVGAHAVELTDVAGNDYEKAIDMMTGMGIIKGYEDGTFRPDGTVRRCEMAKMIAVAMVGKEFNFGTSSKPMFEDVKDGWARPYVEYCKNMGYINGRSDTIFDPDGLVTSTEAARMLLNILGIRDGATGDGWAIKTEIDARNIGLYGSGLEDAIEDTNAPLTRDKAAQMLWHAMTYSESSDDTVYIVKTGTTVNYSGPDPMMALLVKTQNAGSTMTTETAAPKDSIAGRVFGYKSTVERDAFGRGTTTITNGKAGTSKKVYAAYDPTLVKTYTEEVTVSQVYNDLGLVAPAVVAKWYIDGFQDDTDTALTLTKADTTNTIGGQGTTTQVYKDGAAVTVIQVATYLGKVTKVIAAKAATATTAAVKAGVEVRVFGTDYEGNLACTWTFNTTDEFKVGDYVLVTAQNTHDPAKEATTGAMVLQSVEKAPAITGAVTASTDTYFKVSGTEMDLAEKNVGVIASNSTHTKTVTVGATDGYKYDNDKEYTYYTDKLGNVLLAVEGAAAAAAEDRYIFVLSTAAKNGTNPANDLYGSTTATEAAAQAKVVDLETGEVKIVNQGIVKETVNGTTTWYWADANGAKGTAMNNTNADGAVNAVNEFRTYTVLEDGSYVLGTSAPSGSGIEVVNANNSGSLVTTADAAAITGAAGYANDSTKITALVFKADWSKVDVETVTGIANFGKTYKGQALALSNATTGLISSIVVIEPAATTSTANFAVYAGQGEKSAAGQAYKFVVNGEVKNYYLGAKDDNTTAEITASAKDVVTLQFDATTGKINADVAAYTDNRTADATVKAVEPTFFVDGASAVKYFADEFVIVDGTGANPTFAVTTLKVGDTVTYWVADSKIVFAVVTAHAAS